MLLKTANEIFGFEDILNNDGNPVSYEVLPPRIDGSEQYMAELDEDYIFPVEESNALAMALDSRVKEACFIYGPHGSGKSSLAEQTCLRMGRPSLRLQHTVDTEVTDIVGSTQLRDNKTVFEYGPLARCMIMGLVYIADEYDFAVPNVLAVYQAVLEGGALFIKSAPEDMAVVKPHPDFRIIATGNTNGTGDETGLYQGTQIQNAANFSRFATTIKLDYQDPKDEQRIIERKVGNIDKDDVGKIMEFTKLVRKSRDQGDITNVLSTRELISICRKAMLKGRDEPAWEYAIKLGFTNRLSTTEAIVVNNLRQRVFG